MSNAYGDTGPHLASWEAQRDEMVAKTLDCPHCKAAKTRARKADKPDADKAMCRPCRDYLRVSYRNHPASESYWCS